MRNGMARALAVTALTSLVLCRSAAAASSEMIHNGGFEEGNWAGVALGWTNESWGSLNAQFEVTGDKPQLGKYCQHIKVEEFKQGAAQLCQGGTAVSKGHRYSVVLWMRGSLSTPVTIGFRKRGAPYNYYLQQSVQVSPAWQRFTVTGVASDTDEAAGLYLFFSGNGDLWIDNVSAKPETTGTTEATPSH